MSKLYLYICTKQTSEPYVPPVTADVRRLSRDTADGFAALQGGYLRVGQIAQFPLQRAVASHLLCDGREVSKASFPELYEYLGDSEGTPTDPTNFVLPNFIGAAALVPAATAVVETVQGSSVTSETAVPGDGQSGGSKVYEVDSGGRYLDQNLSS